MNSLGVLCCIERCSAKSSVTQLGSPPGCDAHIGQTCNKSYSITIHKHTYRPFINMLFIFNENYTMISNITNCFNVIIA